MLFLVFSMGNERFAIDASHIAEVIPRLRLKAVPKAPDWVAGVMQYRGEVVPVVDLCRLNLGRAAGKMLSTRIIVVRYRARDAATHLLGLLAEQVTDTLRRDIREFSPVGVATPQAPYLGEVTAYDGGLLQLVDVAGLLPDSVQSLLFPAESTGA